MFTRSSKVLLVGGEYNTVSDAIDTILENVRCFFAFLKVGCVVVYEQCVVLGFIDAEIEIKVILRMTRRRCEFDYS